VSVVEAKREEITALSHKIEDLLLEDQRKARAPQGMAKCPLCGTVVAPTRNGRIRVHMSNPFTRERCEASTKRWGDYGARTPKPRKGQDLT